MFRCLSRKARSPLEADERGVGHCFCRSKHVNRSKERYLLGQKKPKNAIYWDKIPQRTLFIGTKYPKERYLLGQNTPKERYLLGQNTPKNAIYWDKIPQRTLFIGTKYPKERYLLGQNTQKNVIYWDKIPINSVLLNLLCVWILF